MRVSGLVARSTVRTVLLLFSGRLKRSKYLVCPWERGFGQMQLEASFGCCHALPQFLAFSSLIIHWQWFWARPSMSTRLLSTLFLPKVVMFCFFLTPCTPHCVSKFSPIYGPIDWKSTWASLYFLPSDRHVSDVNRKIAHGALYVADRLISFGLDVPAACSCGATLERPAHLFFRCPLARSGVDWVQNLLSTFSVDAPSLDVRHLLFGFSEADLRTVPKVFCYIRNVCKFFIWSQRNDFSFRSVRPSAVRLICSIKARLHFFLLVFFRLFRSARRRRVFHKQWGANGVIAW